MARGVARVAAIPKENVEVPVGAELEGAAGVTEIRLGLAQDLNEGGWIDGPRLRGRPCHPAEYRIDDRSGRAGRVVPAVHETVRRIVGMKGNSPQPRGDGEGKWRRKIDEEDGRDHAVLKDPNLTLSLHQEEPRISGNRSHRKRVHQTVRRISHELESGRGDLGWWRTTREERQDGVSEHATSVGTHG